MLLLLLLMQGYRDQMIEPYQQVPAFLNGKEDILFGNLPEIYSFHSQVLLPDLECSLSSCQLVARCFLRHVRVLPRCIFHFSSV